MKVGGSCGARPSRKPPITKHRSGLRSRTKFIDSIIRIGSIFGREGLLRMCFLNNSTFFVLQGRYADKVFGIPMLKQYYSDYSFDRLSQS